jgi:hypothetical protein
MSDLLPTKRRKPSRRQIASRRRNRAQERVNTYRQRIYKVFSSATSYRRRLLAIPENAATTTLSAKWCDYTAYAPREQGEHLLNRMRQAELVLQRRQREWEDVYYPGQRELEEEKERMRQDLRRAREEEQRRAREAFLSGFDPANRRWLESGPDVTCFGMHVYNPHGYNVRRVPQTDEEVAVLRSLDARDAQGWLSYADWLDDVDPAVATKIRSHVGHVQASAEQRRDRCTHAGF